MEVLKLATAGSVDDGKSTLIGRLLYDTQSLTDDKLEAIKRSSEKKGYDYLDFSLATDGLVAEREQGITIDVAHIYFSTANKSYIIADSPGHIEYTRNMITGASNASASIILVDARKGVVEQTFRHFFINALLRVKHVIVAINKMDLVDFDVATYDAIKSDFEALRLKSDFKEQELQFIPISALLGDNVATHSSKMPWYNGPSLLQYLEGLTSQGTQFQQMRLPIQMVIRPKKEGFHDFRGYTGKLYGDGLRVGDLVTILPSKKNSKIKEISFYTDTFKEAKSGNSVTVTLEDDLQINRGDLIVRQHEVPQETKLVKAVINWMDTTPLTVGKKYKIKHMTQLVLAKVDEITRIVPTDFSASEAKVQNVQLNDIAEVVLKLARPLYCDRFIDHRQGGSFIIIDTNTNTTAGVGFIK